MYNSLTINLYFTLIIRSIITIFLYKNISPPTTRRRDILHYFFKRLAIKDAPTTRMTAPILMNNAYGSTV